jgi:hypothetical protein
MGAQIPFRFALSLALGRIYRHRHVMGLARLLAFVMLCAAPVGPYGVIVSMEEDESVHVEQQASFVRHRAVHQPPLPAPALARRMAGPLRAQVARRGASPRPPRRAPRRTGRPRRAVLYDDGDDGEDDAPTR